MKVTVRIKFRITWIEVIWPVLPQCGVRITKKGRKAVFLELEVWLISKKLIGLLARFGLTRLGEKKNYVHSDLPC